MMLSAFVLIVSTLANDTEPLDTIRMFDASYAKELAEAAHLPALSAAQDEVRVWSETAFFGGISGRVITKSEIRIYSNRSDVGGSRRVENEFRLEKTIRDGRRASALLRRFTQLSALNDKDYSCGFDGTAIALEGIVNGQHFSFSAANPGLCQDSEARRVARLFSELVQAGRSAP